MYAVSPLFVEQGTSIAVSILYIFSIFREVLIFEVNNLTKISCDYYKLC